MGKCECHGHPPGDEIYREAVRTDPATGKAAPQLQLWEVDGKKAKVGHAFPVVHDRFHYQIALLSKCVLACTAISGSQDLVL
jgi:hypothetical protein